MQGIEGVAPLALRKSRWFVDRLRVLVDSRRLVGVAVALIALAGCLAYLGSMGGPFVFDDASSITSNPTLRPGWSLWDVLATPANNVTAQGRPLLNLSLAINYSVSGTEVWSYHALNLIIHLLAGITLFGVVRRSLRAWFGSAELLASPAEPGGRFATDSRRELAAAVVGLGVALLWTVHPLQTESVTYVVQRAESLMGWFYLLTLYCWIRLLEPGTVAGKRRWGWLAIGTCLLGMATKEVMVTAPVVLLIYDRTFFAGRFRAAWQARRGFYLGLAATWIVLGLCLLRGGGNRGGSIGLNVGVAPWTYALTQVEAIGRYLWLSFWPHPLVFEYGPFQVTAAKQLFPWILILGPLLVGTIWAFWRRPPLGFLGVWFFALLAPTSLVPGTSQMIVEHRMYLPLAAVLTGAVWGGFVLTLRATGQGLGASSVHPVEENRWSAATLFSGSGAYFLGWVGALALALGVITTQRNAVYRSGISLWSDTVGKRPGNALAHHLLAEEWLQAGRPQDALVHYRQAVQLNPDFFMAHERLGELLLRLGFPLDAEPHFRAALRLRPDFADAHDNLGSLLAEQGRLDEALAHMSRAIEIQPDYVEAHFNLASVLVRLRRGAEARRYFEAAIRLRPGFAAAHFNLANTLVDLEQPAEARLHYETALRIKPDYPAAEYNLANLLAAARRMDEAIVHYRSALRLKPDYAVAELNLGSALFERGQLDEAEAHYLAALKLDPSLDDARENLVRVRAARRR